MDLSKKRITITGGAGFLGRYVVKKLLERGVPEKNIFVPRSKAYDLRKNEDIKKMFSDFMPDVLIHLSGKIAGIGFNQKIPGELFYDNIIAGVQLIEQARLHKVEKAVIAGTVCSYPKYAPVPFRESDLWNGYPEETNAPYSLAKKMLLVQQQAYKQQYNFNSIHLLITNLYGPEDNFDEKTAQVIPAIIKKVYWAKQNNAKKITLLGDGSASREFLYVEDAADAIVLAAEKYNKTEPVNIGSGKEITIKELAKLIFKLMDFKGEIKWDTRKPNGQPRRWLDVSKAAAEFGFIASTDFEEGLKKTIEWYRNSEISGKNNKNRLICS